MRATRALREREPREERLLSADDQRSEFISTDYPRPEPRSTFTISITTIPSTDGECDAGPTLAPRQLNERFLTGTGARLWIPHDMLANAKLKKGRASYQYPRTVQQREPVRAPQPTDHRTAVDPLGSAIAVAFPYSL